jgi:hypothetical protein
LHVRCPDLEPAPSTTGRAGALYYDTDCIGGHAGIQFATLVNKPVLAAGDFAVI